LAVFVKSATIDARIETVFGFHEREDALQLLSPTFPPIRIIQKTGGIEAGARVEIAVAFIRWSALHTAYDRNRLFVDEQVRGPFAKWVHRHEFEDLGVSTRLTDRVEFVLRGGPIVIAALGWVVRLGLNRIFAQRHKTTKRFCERFSP